MAMKLILVLFSVASAQPSPAPSGTANLGKDTYAMSHPFAWKAFMEKYFPTAENVIQQNSTSTCNEWVKLCIDDGYMKACSGPHGTFQMHAVGAYKRDSGAKSMEELEMAFTRSMGDMKKYDPYFEYHMAFITPDLDTYVSAFDADKVPYFASTFTATDGTVYKSILVQTPGSLKAGAKSMINIEILGSSSSILEARSGLHHHDVPRASPEVLAAAASHLARAPRKVGANSKPVLAKLHRSFASSDVSRDQRYFESAMQGTGSLSGGVYTGKIVSIDNADIRYVDTSSKTTQGPTSVREWENYQVNLHKKCFNTAKNEGFDRLADNHLGHNLGGDYIDALIKGQQASGLPYRFYGQVAKPFFYMYAPNGWGLQVIGPVSDSSLEPKSLTNYGFCTQGITGHCSVDQVSEVIV